MGLRSLFPSVTLVLLLALLVCNNICITCFLTPRLPSALHRNRFQRSNNEIYAQFISSSEIENGRESGRECLSKTADHSESNSDYFSILTSKTRDRSVLNDAIMKLMKDPIFIKKSNSLSLISEALKNCKIPSHLMFYFWKEMFYLGAAVKKQDVKDLLFYCYKFDKRDSITLQSMLDFVSSLDISKYWNTAIFNLIIQLHTEKYDSIYNKKEIIQNGVTLSKHVNPLSTS